MVVREVLTREFPIMVSVRKDKGKHAGTWLYFHSYATAAPARGDYPSELEYCRAYVERSNWTPKDSGLQGYEVDGKWYYLSNSILGSVCFSSEACAKLFLLEAGIDSTERAVRVGTYGEVVHGGKYGE